MRAGDHPNGGAADKSTRPGAEAGLHIQNRQSGGPSSDEKASWSLSSEEVLREKCWRKNSKSQG